MTGPRLSIIPAGAVTDRSLEPRDLQVLCLLGRHIDKAGWCVRSQVRMAAELDCGRSSVQRSLERLVDAGWVEKKRRGQLPDGADPEGQPSASYAYRVRLDRDDYVFGTARESAENDGDGDVPSHAESASQEPVCPQVGSRSEPIADTENHPQGAQPDGHGGAQPYVGTGAQPYVGTSNDPLERPQAERERERARARDRKARGLLDFEARWPTAAADDRQRTAYAFEELSEAEAEAALAGIKPFLDNLKKLGRKNVPAGWKYLEEKRWTLLVEAALEPLQLSSFPPDTPEAKAIALIYALSGKQSAFFSYVRTRDGTVHYRREVTPQLLALAQAPTQAQWQSLNRQQAGAWNDLIDTAVASETRNHLKEGDRAPWPWPPSKEGKIYAETTGPPSQPLMTEADEREVAEHGLRAR